MQNEWKKRTYERGNMLKKVSFSFFVIFLFSSCTSTPPPTNTIPVLPQIQSNESGGFTSGRVMRISESVNPETARPNTRIVASFSGQTRASGTSTLTPYRVNIISEGLSRPWAIINLPDGRFLITEKGGSAVIMTSDGKERKSVTGFPSVDDRGQGGLLDIALDPDFLNNRMVYWSYTEKFDTGNHTAVARGRLADNETQVENVSVIFRATPTYDGSLHYGSRIVFDREGNLIFSTGERSDRKTRPLAEDNTMYLGKILRIKPDGNPALGNPRIPGWKPEILSTGHRNPQGLAIHPITGDLWEGEMGPRGGDEINRIEGGKDYGWPTITYGEEYSGFQVGEGIGAAEGLEQPVYYWDPSISPSGMDFYRGTIDEWKNNLIVGALSGEKIIRLVLDMNTDRVIAEEWLLTGRRERFRDILSGIDGNLYAITDSGKLYRISRE